MLTGRVYEEFPALRHLGWVGLGLSNLKFVLLCVGGSQDPLVAD